MMPKVRWVLVHGRTSGSGRIGRAANPAVATGMWPTAEWSPRRFASTLRHRTCTPLRWHGLSTEASRRRMVVEPEVTIGYRTQGIGALWRPDHAPERKRDGRWQIDPLPTRQSESANGFATVLVSNRYCT